jgi:hypothetical protein
MLAASVIAGALIIFAFAHAPFQRAGARSPPALRVGLLVAAGWFATGYLGADDFNPAAGHLADLHRADRGRVAICHAVDRADLNFGIAWWPACSPEVW